MTSQFLRDFLEQTVELNDEERSVLQAVDARSYEDIDSFVRSAPSMVEHGLRPMVLANAVQPFLSPAYSSVVDRMQVRRRVFRFGANVLTAGAAGTSRSPKPRSNAPTPPTPPSAPTYSPQPTFDLRLRSWPVKDQGDRGTCVAFGAAACMEHFVRQAGAEQSDLSEQFLYWAIKAQSNDPDKDGEGTFLSYARDMLVQFGICVESLWRYVPTRVTPESGQTDRDPSSEAISEAAARQVQLAAYMPSPSRPAELLIGLLEEERPIAVCLNVLGDASLPVYVNDWTEATALTFGNILNPASWMHVKCGHCVCVTGFVADEDEPNGGYFIFRNSWGTDFAEKAPNPRFLSPEQGYGSISAKYVDNHCTEILQIRDV